MIRDYPAMIEWADHDECRIAFPDFPECTAAGATIEQAVANGREAVLLQLVVRLADSGTVPEPSAPDAPIPDWLDQDSVWTRVMVSVEWLPTADL